VNTTMDAATARENDVPRPFGRIVECDICTP
jgi:hypothetical protein